MATVCVVGIGPGNPNCLTLEALESLNKAEAVAASARQAQTVQEAVGLEGKRVIQVGGSRSLVQSVNEIRECVDMGLNTVVCVSGDPGFHSLLPFLKKSFKSVGFKIIPGVSSIQYFASKLGVAWQDADLISLHGGDGELGKALERGGDIFALTDPEHNVGYVARALEKYPGHYEMFVGENLSYGDERITRMGVDEAAVLGSTENPCVIYLKAVDNGA